MILSGMSVAVVGGGIGGMAAAAALGQRGADVTVYERAPDLIEVGAGLQVSANGQRVLTALGATSGPPKGATVSQGTVINDGRVGRRVTKVPAPFAGSTWYVHRADLLALLVKSAREAGVAIQLGRSVIPGNIRADLIVAADGMKSVWRSQVDGSDTPLFTGQVAWRAVVPMPTTDQTDAALTMGHRAHVVSYPLRNGTVMNLVAVEERDDWTAEGWSLAGDVAEFRARFTDFGGTAGDLIRRTEAVHQWGLHVRPVARTWAKDNVVLLGDAAHPTLPFMAQGACLALEDAWVLADALRNAEDLSAGLETYQQVRRPRAQRVVSLARGNAWRFHLGKPLAWGAQAVLAVGSGILARRLEWVYSYDPTKVLMGKL